MTEWYIIGGSFGLFLMVQYLAFLLFLLRKGGAREVKFDLLYIIAVGALISLLGFGHLAEARIAFPFWRLEWVLLIAVLLCFVFLLRYIFVYVKNMGCVETDGYREYTHWYLAGSAVVAVSMMVAVLLVPEAWVRQRGNWAEWGVVVYFLIVGLVEGYEFVLLMVREKGKISSVNTLRYRTLLLGGECSIVLWMISVGTRFSLPVFSGMMLGAGFVLMSLSMSFYLVFEYIDVSIKEAEAKKKLLEIHKKMMEEVRIAQSLQISLLPIERQRALQKVIDMEISYMPMQSVGGDYYDMFMLSDDLYLFLLGDASGHGIYAAMIWAMLKVEVEELIEERKFSSLSEAFTTLNRRITRILENTYSYITLFAVLVNRKSKTLKYLSAGHINQFYYCVREKQVKQLKNKNPIVGTFKNVRFQEDVFKYHPGDVLLLFSDGVIEGTNQEGGQVGLEQLVEIFSGVVVDAMSASEVISRMLMRLEDFYEGAIHDDDRTFMTIRF